MDDQLLNFVIFDKFKIVGVVLNTDNQPRCGAGGMRQDHDGVKYWVKYWEVGSGKCSDLEGIQFGGDQ